MLKARARLAPFGSVPSSEATGSNKMRASDGGVRDLRCASLIPSQLMQSEYYLGEHTPSPKIDLRCACLYPLGKHNPPSGNTLRSFPSCPVVRSFLAWWRCVMPHGMARGASHRPLGILTSSILKSYSVNSLHKGVEGDWKG
jgi:hypothetical protein